MSLKRQVLSAVISIIMGAIWSNALSAQISPSPYTYAIRYDAAGLVTGTIAADPDGAGPLHFAAVRNTYDPAGRLIKVEKGELSSWQSEAITPATWTSFTIVQTVETTYNSADQKILVTLKGTDGVAKAQTQFSYNSRNDLDCTAVRMNPAQYGSPPSSACVLGPEGSQGPDRITRNIYDDAGQLIQLRVAVGTNLEAPQVTYILTPNGKHGSVIDGEGNTAQLSYDEFDRLARWTFPTMQRPVAFDGSTYTTAISSAGPVNGADHEDYGYDANGNRTTLIKRDGRTLRYTYDALQRLISKCATSTTCVVPNAATGRDVYYSYDLSGHQLSARFDNASGVDGVTNTYDGFGNVSASTISIAGFTKTIASTYDLDNNRIGVTHPDGQAFTYTYDGVDRAIGIAEAGVPAMIGFNYDNAGRLNWLNRVNGRQTLTEFDSISRVSALTNTSYGSSADVRFDFTYNPSSQIVVRSASNDTYAFNGLITVNRDYGTNGLDQYTSAGPSAFTYDQNGNLTSDGSNSYVYDVENRLVSATTAGQAAALTYDSLGRLFQVVKNSSNARFLYDGDALIGEYDASGNIVNRYVHGSNAASDDPLVEYQGVGLNNKHYLEIDHQGSVILLSDTAGATINVNRYDEYGIPSASNTGRFQYTGQIWIPALGMYYYKARIYSPTLGRFLQVDPVGYDDQTNLYGYVGNDPINKTDPTGQQLQALARACLGEQGILCVGIGLVGAMTLEAVIQHQRRVNGNHVNSVSSLPPPQVWDEIPKTHPAARKRTTGFTRTQSDTRRNDPYTVRVQIQGTNLGTERTLPISQQTPVSSSELKTALMGLYGSLSGREQKDALPAMTGIFQAIDNAVANGGVEPGTNLQGTNVNYTGRELRIDVEIIEGRNLPF